MIIETLELRDFRNYESETVVFHEKINILTGKNGQGKTNLVEAVNLLALGKSFRTRKEAELVRFGAESASVRGAFLKRDRGLSVGVFLRGGAGARSAYEVDGVESASVSDLLGGVYTVVFSPEDLRVVKGEPEMRRRFLDRELILLRPVYYHKLKRYRGVLRNRNAFLKGVGGGLGEGGGPGAGVRAGASGRLGAGEHCSPLLDVYDAQLAGAAADVMRERATYVRRLSAAASEAGEKITGGGDTLSVEYRPNVSFIDDENCEKAVLAALLKGRERDLLMRSTEAGPHRDDFSVSADGLDLRVYGSQGQQRTAALSLRLAERALIKEETGEDAILLLDDVMSELDAGRQERLLASFGENQIFITAAGPSRAEAKRLSAAKVMRIDGGRVV